MTTGVDSKNLVQKLAKSADEGRLVVVIGTGVSMALTNGANAALSWVGLIRDGFAEGLRKELITSAQNENYKALIASEDLDDLLGAAEFIGKKLGSPSGDIYAKWLSRTFKGVRPINAEMKNAILSLQARGALLCTLNYDSLLENVTGLPSILVKDAAQVAPWLRREEPGILHLHGKWDVPESCVLGIRDYNATVGHDLRDFIQRSLVSLNTLLFIGCGDTFADPNFSALIPWLRQNLKAAVPDHYALVVNADVARRQADKSWSGFVEPVGYGEKRDELAGYLVEGFGAGPRRNKRARATRSKASPTSINNEKILEEYRAFLIKDCGEMTIEGVRADMDIAQRKFDLERLFVPLEVLRPLPDISPMDPEREQKLAQWQENHGKPLPFGKIFSEHQKIALLALPGGGKTLLLKRLAVAYADPARRLVGGDNLPDLDLTPLLIRCREWRAHISLPIPTLLQKIAEITGQSKLAGLPEALAPLLKAGRVLLLVDGLDEIHNDADRKTFVEHLEVFLKEYKDTRAVVTSREAGFALVAPSLARFCERWRVAPLNNGAISTLCDHWTDQMSGSSPEAQKDARQLSQRIIANASLLRLAENPLLLTMLLVVKHGAGRLPLERVLLYERATEVLLDTWNIQGNEPLNMKESVPQLACVAYQLLEAGKQTATEKQLLKILEDGREKVDQIRRYAKDAPDTFLKRVERRSSLLVEGGHQLEDGKIVPFYQFRHLTFQEYLAAVAVTNGYYFEYDERNDVLTPLASVMLSEGWKEVVPMTAVLARKQAEPLMEALLKEGIKLRTQFERAGKAKELEAWLAFPPKLPPAVARLLQCLVEEAEATPATLTGALRLVIYFCKGARTEGDWLALAQGPYGNDLLHQAWQMYRANDWKEEALVRSSFAVLASMRYPIATNLDPEAHAKILSRLADSNTQEVSTALMSMVGSIIRGERVADVLTFHAAIAEKMFSDEEAIWDPAVWAWGLLCNREAAVELPSPKILNLLLSLWLATVDRGRQRVIGLALRNLPNLKRDDWSPQLSSADIARVKERSLRREVTPHDQGTAIVIAFFCKCVWSDEELVSKIDEAKKANAISQKLASRMLRELAVVRE